MLLEKGMSSAPELARGSGDVAYAFTPTSIQGIAVCLTLACVVSRLEGFRAAQCFTGLDSAQLCELLPAKPGSQSTQTSYLNPSV